MAASGYCTIGEQPASPWKMAVIGMAAGAVAALAFTMAPHHTQQWATAVSTSEAVRLVPAVRQVASNHVEGTSSHQAAFPLSAQDESIVYSTQSPQSQSTSTLLFTASGVLMALAAAIWRLAGNTAPKYAMWAATAEQQRLERLARLQADERAVQERRQRLAREEAQRRGVMQLSAPSTPQAAVAASAPAPVASNDWERDQLRLRERRERLEREKVEAARREVQERLQRLQRQFGSSPQAPAAAAPHASPLPASDDLQGRKLARERAEQEKVERAQREVQERLERLKRLGAATAQATPAASEPAAASYSTPVDGDWQRRQQEREIREREKQVQAQREVQERLQRLQRLK